MACLRTKIGRRGWQSQSFGRGWVSFSTHVLARALFSFTSLSLAMLGSMVWQIRCIPIGGVVSSAAVAVVFGVVGSATEAQGVPISGDGPFQVAYRGRGWSAAACFVVAFFFLRACYPIPISLVSGADTAVHTWVYVELRVIGQHVAVNIKNPNLSWVHGRVPQQKSTFLPWTGVLKGGLGCIRGVVLGHLARTKMLGLPERFGVARLLEDIVELVYMGYLLSVIQAWFILIRGI